MAPDDFLRAFEAGELPPSGFRHRDHVHAAWLCVKKYDLPEALARFSRALRGLAAAAGRPQLYHETITVAYLLTINERARGLPAHGSWEDFAAANPDLFAWNPSILDEQYDAATLASDFARSTFVWPNRHRRPRAPAPEAIDLIGLASRTILERYREGRHHVCAALRGASGRSYTALHVETYVGRCAVCAEGAAVARATTEGESQVRMIVAVRYRGEGVPRVVSPCGACREMLCDYGNPLVIHPDGAGWAASHASALLPDRTTRPGEARWVTGPENGIESR